MVKKESAEAVVVTGAASGIGRAMAMESTASGRDVVLVDRDATGIEATAQTIAHASAGRVLGSITVDLGESDSPEAVIAALRQIESRPTSLFHAAGIIIRRDSIDAVTAEDWDKQVTINQRASWFLTRAFCQMLQAERLSGSAVLVSSVSGALGLVSGSWVYASTKAAVSSMTKGFAKTYGPHGIRVNAIAPGLVETPMVRGSVRDNEVGQLIENNVPLRRTADPAEIARAGLFLVSDAASYITGVTLDVDGGWLRR